MNEETLQILLAKISAFAALGGSLLGSLTTLFSVWLERRIQENGKVDVFCRIVASIPDQKTFGVYRISNEEGLIMRIPMWIEITNTSGISRFIRDINVVGYHGKTELCEFTQFQGINIGKDNETSYGNNQSYTMVVEPNSAKRFNVEFALKETEFPDLDEINTLKIRYFDEKNKKHLKDIYRIKDGTIWKERQFDYKKQWIRASK